MKNCVIIVAGGNGSRMENAVPKQFLPLEGIPILMHTIHVFHEFDPGIHIIVILPDAERKKWEELCEAKNFEVPHTLACGGETRFHSVKNGLALVPECDLIAVHDGVRPLVSYETLNRCFTTAKEMGSAIPVLPANESMREGTLEASHPLNRSRLFMVQTPQVFNALILRSAYKQDFSEEFTDDASVVEKTGFPVQMVNGNRENIKITYPEDLEIAAMFLRKS